MADVTKRDYYEVLGVPRDAGEADLKRAYRRLALENHPDKKPGDAEAEERFKEASEAYEVLSDPDRRARYDQFGHEGVRHGGFRDAASVFSSFGDLFEQLFGKILKLPTALVDIGLWIVVLKALAAVVLGGFGSIPGAIVGGLLLGMIEQFAGVYLPDGFKDAMAYIVLIGVLIVWPRGLLGEAHGRRV